MSERMAVITRASRGSGAVFQVGGGICLLFSVVLLVSMPVLLILSFPAAVVFILVGGARARRLHCSACGGVIPHQSVAICKHCRSTFRDSRVH